MTVHLPDPQAAPISGRAAAARPFRQGRRGLLRHPVDAVGRPARARNPARRHPGRAHPPRGPLHRARARRSPTRRVRVLREAEELAEMARAEGQPLHGELRMGVIPTIAPVPAAGDAAAAARANGRASSSTCARRPARPPARRSTAASSTACCSPCPYACGEVDMRAAVRRPAVRRLPARRGAGAADGRCRRRSTRTGCCCSRTAIASRTMRCRPATGPSCAPQAAMMGTSLHTLVQMVDNGLGADLRPGDGDRRGHPRRHAASTPGRCDPITASAAIALIWRRSSPRESEFQLLAATLRRIMRDSSGDGIDRRAEPSRAAASAAGRGGLRRQADRRSRLLGHRRLGDA